MHTGDKPFKCDVEGCDYASSQPQHLATHKLSKHSGERPFRCELPGCDFSATRAYYVTRHMTTSRKHQGQQPPTQKPAAGSNTVVVKHEKQSQQTWAWQQQQQLEQLEQAAGQAREMTTDCIYVDTGSSDGDGSSI